MDIFEKQATSPVVLVIQTKKMEVVSDCRKSILGSNFFGDYFTFVFLLINKVFLLLSTVRKLLTIFFLFAIFSISYKS